MPQNGKKTNNGGGNQSVPRTGRRRNRGRRQRAGQGPSSALSTVVKHGLNAFHPCHVSLPVPSGKYTVIRTNRTYTTTDFLSLIGPMNAADGWGTYLSVAKAGATSALNSADWAFRAGPSPTGTAGVGFGEVVPAACSVQVVSPASLTSASGVVYMGRCQTGLSQPATSDARTAQEFADALISFSNPKLMSGARLAMSPQQVNLVPANVAELSDFRELHIGADYAAAAWNTGNDFIGFKPMFIINPSGVELEVRVCVEWRVRLSPFNPMHNSQTLHPPTAPSVWHGIISAAESVGHGVEDVGIAGAAGYMMSGVGKGFFNAAKNYIGGAARAALPAIEGAAEAAPLLLL